jgi:hypothetical protein
MKRAGALFVWLISHQSVVLFSQNKPTIINQPTILFYQNKLASAITHQPNEQVAGGQNVFVGILGAGLKANYLQLPN